MELVDELVNIIQTAQRLSDRYGDILDRLKTNLRGRIKERKKKDKRFYYIEKYVKADDKEGKKKAITKLKKLIQS